jgi:hypothetical protein
LHSILWLRPSLNTQYPLACYSEIFKFLTGCMHALRFQTQQWSVKWNTRQARLPYNEMMTPDGSVLFLFWFTTSRGQGWYQISSHFIVASVALCLLYAISYFLHPFASGLSDLNPIKIWIGQVLTVDVSLSSLSFRGFLFLSLCHSHSLKHTHTHTHTLTVDRKSGWAAYKHICRP